MEGDLLGLDFGQTPAPTQTPQSVQTNGLFQLQSPSSVQFQAPTFQLPPPSAAQQPPPSAAQQPPPVAHLPPPATQVAAPATQVAPQLAPPSAYNQPPSVQQQPPTVQQQQPTFQPSQPQAQSALSPVTITSITVQNFANPQNAAAAQTIWKPLPTQDEPKDPVLKDIKEKFGGRWRLVRSDPYDDYLKAAGVGIFARKLAITGPLEQHIEIKGNNIHINFHSTFHNQINVFRLEESIENVVEKSRQSVFCSYKDGKLTLLMTPLEPGLNRTQEVQRYINEHGELVGIYTCGTATCRRYFSKMADLVAPLNIVG